MSIFSFTQTQVDTLAAAADRIIPPDQHSGAADAGAVNFIIGLLNAELCGEQITYTAGLDGIDQEANARHNEPFASLTPQQQDAILVEIEEDRIKTVWLISPRNFFLMLVENVLEGFYADPGNGGNRDQVSWKMIGFRAEGGTW